MRPPFFQISQQIFTAYKIDTRKNKDGGNEGRAVQKGNSQYNHQRNSKAYKEKKAFYKNL